MSVKDYVSCPFQKSACEENCVLYCGDACAIKKIAMGHKEITDQVSRLTEFVVDVLEPLAIRVDEEGLEKIDMIGEALCEIGNAITKGGGEK